MLKKAKKLKKLKMGAKKPQKTILDGFLRQKSIHLERILFGWRNEKRGQGVPRLQSHTPSLRYSVFQSARKYLAHNHQNSPFLSAQIFKVQQTYPFSVQRKYDFVKGHFALFCRAEKGDQANTARFRRRSEQKTGKIKKSKKLKKKLDKPLFM